MAPRPPRPAGTVQHPNKPKPSPRTQRDKVQQIAKPVPLPPPPVHPPAASPVPALDRDLGMTEASRYNHNLNVLRRRDPSIVSIFDRFSHVCVYHYNGEKWEKQGFEGTMFIYERDSYPPYGIYILNRMGSDDYIQRLYPENEMSLSGNILVIRSFADFTARRLADAATRATSQSKFDPAYTIDKPELLTAAVKGPSVTIGLWMFATDAREPLIDVMKRLHGYVKKNQPYPEEYKYGPNRQPPPNPHLHTAPVQDQQMVVPSTTQPSHTLDSLFAKLAPQPPPPQSNYPTAQVTLAGLFASVGGNEQTTSDATQPRGLALLDTIFASASSSTPAGATRKSLETSSIPPPGSREQLNRTSHQNGLINLMGLSSPHSRGSSLASNTSSRSSRSQPSRYSGDAEDEDGEGDSSNSGYSTSSTVLDPDVEGTLELPPAPVRQLSLTVPTSRSGEFGQIEDGRRINGDVTPRPGMGVFRGSTAFAAANGVFSTPRSNSQLHLSPPSRHETLTGRATSRIGSPPTFSTPLADSSLLPNANTVGKHKLKANMPLSPARPSHSPPIEGKKPMLPFEASSELWAPRESQLVDETEIVELDFADTSALSDMAMFGSKQREKGDTVTQVNGKAKKKGKKERALEREKEAARSGGVVLLPRASGSNSTTQTLPVQSPKLDLDKTPNPTSSTINGHHIRDSIIASLSSVAKPVKSVERNEFVREVLTLIHTDHAFVDNLWQEYNARRC